MGNQRPPLDNTRSPPLQTHARTSSQRPSLQLLQKSFRNLARREKRAKPSRTRLTTTRRTRRMPSANQRTQTNATQNQLPMEPTSSKRKKKTRKKPRTSNMLVMWRTNRHDVATNTRESLHPRPRHATSKRRKTLRRDQASTQDMQLSAQRNQIKNEANNNRMVTQPTPTTHTPGGTLPSTPIPATYR